MLKDIKTPLFRICIYFFIVVLFFPSDAYAYLDPGSGSALFTSIIAIATAAFYTIKVLYYRILGKNITVDKHVSPDTLLVFSEGKTYWGTFEPIVQNLIKKKIHFRYISLDLHDPALEIESEYMHSKLYPRTSYGFGKIEAMRAPIMLATTPNIGSEGYPIARPKNVKNLTHIFHSVTDSSNYNLGSLDFYDSVIMAGEHEREYLERVELKRNIPHKEMIALGIPYMDTLNVKLLKNKANYTKKETSKKTLLVAPSWGNKGCFNYFGTSFVLDLIAKGYNVIVRLHPHSHIAEPENVAKWKRELAGHNIIWDEELYSTQSMLEADILISDTSSVRFDFAFLYLKPVITLNIPQESRENFEAIYHEITWDRIIAPQLGAVVEKEAISSLPSILENVENTFDSEKLMTIRDANIANFGNASEYIVDFLQAKIAEITSAVEAPNK